MRDFINEWANSLRIHIPSTRYECIDTIVNGYEICSLRRITVDAMNEATNNPNDYSSRAIYIVSVARQILITWDNCRRMNVIREEKLFNYFESHFIFWLTDRWVDEKFRMEGRMTHDKRVFQQNASSVYMCWAVVETLGPQQSAYHPLSCALQL